MTDILPRDVLLYAGGDAWRRFGAFTRRTTRIQRNGETQAEVFTRADAATCAHFLGADGLYHMAAAGIIRPHWIDTNGDGIVDTLTYLGEPAVKNWLLQSQALATTWSQNNLTSTNNTADVVAPDGTQTATKMVPTVTSSSSHSVTQTVTATSGEFLALSVYVRAGAYQAVVLRLSENTFVNTIRIAVNLATGASTTGAQGTGMIGGSSVMALANGWYRILLWGSIGAFTAMVPELLEFDTYAHAQSFTAFAGDGTSGIYAWGAQLERNGTTPLAALPPQEYVATTASTVTKATDACTVPVPADVVPITFYAKFIERGGVTMASQGPRIMALDTGANPRLMLYQSGGKYACLLVDPNAVGTVAAAAASPNYGDLVELVGTYDGVNTVTLTQAINGVPAATVTTGGIVKFSGLWGTSQVGLLCSSTPALNTPGALVRALMVQGVHTLAECQAVT